MELAEELRRKLVDQEKQRLASRRWWHRFIPIITVTWRNK